MARPAADPSLSSAAKAEAAARRCSLALTRIAIELRRHNPDQPRVPAGQTGGGRWTDTGRSRSRILAAQIEQGVLVAELPYTGGGRYCVYRFSYGDIIVPGPNIARCMQRTPWFGAVHGRMLNDNRR